MSRKKIHCIVNPLYEDYKAEIELLPSRFENEGEIIYNLRNCIKKMRVSGQEWNVKSFKIPHCLNRFVYRHLRKAKAERSYLNALRLLRMGVDTPTPIAYILEQNLWGITRSFYVSEQLQYDYVLRELLEQRPDDFEDLLREYVAFVLSFHRKGIYFLDLSTGNTLIVRQPNGKARFYLVDVNRTWFHSHALSCKDGVKAFCRLDSSEEDKNFILQEYARQGGYNRQEVMRLYQYHKKRDDKRRQVKQKFR